MTFPTPKGPTRLVAAALSAAFLVMAACSGSDRDPPSLDSGVNAPLDVDCLGAAQDVLAGSAPFLIQGRVTRGNVPVSGATVVFVATRGLVQPSQAQTGADGIATVQYTPPGTQGAARIDLQVTDRRLGDTASSSCSIDVTDPGNPRLNVQLVVPDQAAGLEVRVQYDPARVDLPAGGARAAGAYAGPSCIALSNDNDFGIVELDIACSTLQAPTGTVATFDFTHLSGNELSASDFTVTCSAVDEQGRNLGAACTSTVTQL